MQSARASEQRAVSGRAERQSRAAAQRQRSFVCRRAVRARQSRECTPQVIASSRVPLHRHPRRLTRPRLSVAAVPPAHRRIPCAGRGGKRPLAAALHSGRHGSGQRSLPLTACCCPHARVRVLAFCTFGGEQRHTAMDDEDSGRIGRWGALALLPRTTSLRASSALWPPDAVRRVRCGGKGAEGSVRGVPGQDPEATHGRHGLVSAPARPRRRGCMAHTRSAPHSILLPRSPSRASVSTAPATARSSAVPRIAHTGRAGLALQLAGLGPVHRERATSALFFVSSHVLGCLPTFIAAAIFTTISCPD